MAQAAINTITLHADPSAAARSAGGETDVMKSLVAAIHIKEVHRGVDVTTLRLGATSAFGQAALRSNYFKQREVLQVNFNGGAVEYLRVDGAKPLPSGGDVVVTCWPFWTNLDRRKLRITREPSGFVDLTLALVGLSPADMLSEIFSHNMGPHFAAGTVHSSLAGTTVSLESNNEDHLALLWKLTEALSEVNGGYPAEFVERWVANVCYIDLVPWRGASAAEIAAGYTADPDSRLIKGPTGSGAFKNRLTCELDHGDRDEFNRIVPVAGPADGLVTIAKALWPVTTASYDGGGDRTTITLGDTPFQAPIDLATDTHYFGNDSRGFFQIETVLANNQVLVIGNAGTLAGDLARVAMNSAGDELVYLQTSEASSTAANEESVSFDVSPFENELVEIDVSENMSTWEVDITPSSPNAEKPQGVGYVGSTIPTLTKYDAATYPAYVRNGPFSCHVEAQVACGVSIGEGVLSLTPSVDEPYHSISVNISVISGSVRVEFVDSGGARHPQGTKRADPKGKQLRAIQIGGPEADAGAAHIEIFTIGETAATFVVDALTVTNSPSAYQYEAEMGPRALWKLGAKHLREQGGSRPTFSTNFIDPTTFDPGSESVEIGSWVRLQDLWDRNALQYDLDETARVVQLVKNYSASGAPITKRVKLANPRPDISSRLIGGSVTSAVDVSPFQGSFSDSFESVFTRIVAGDAVMTVHSTVPAGDILDMSISAFADLKYGERFEVRTNDREAPIPFYLLESVNKGDVDRLVQISVNEPVYGDGFDGFPNAVSNHEAVTLPKDVIAGTGVFMPAVTLQNRIFQNFKLFEVVQTLVQSNEALLRIGVIGTDVSGEVSSLAGLREPPRLNLRKDWPIYIESQAGHTQHVTTSAGVDAGSLSIPIYTETIDVRAGDVIKIDPVFLLSLLRVEPGEVLARVEKGESAVAICDIEDLASGSHPTLPVLGGAQIGTALTDGDNYVIVDRPGNKHAVTVDGDHLATAVTVDISPSLVLASDITKLSLRYPDTSTRAELKIQEGNINHRVEKDDVIHQINISTEGILIQGDNLLVDALVTFASSYDPSDKTETFSGVTAPVSPLPGWLWRDTSSAPTSIYKWSGVAWERYGTDDFDWRHASDQTKIDGGDVYANSVTVTQLNFTPAESTNVIGMINASPEGIDIDADNLSISAATTFAASYDPTTKETPSGAQTKADTAETAANTYTDANAPDIYRQATAPTTPKTDDLWVDTGASGADRKSVKRYNGSSWDVVAVDDSDWRHATDFTKIDGGDIYANTVTTTTLNFIPVESTNVVAKINASAEGLDITLSKLSLNGNMASGDELKSSGYTAGVDGWSMDGDDSVELWMNSDLVLGSSYGLRFGGTQKIEWRNSLPSGALEAWIYSPNTQGVLQMVGDDGGGASAEMLLWGFLEAAYFDIGGTSALSVFETSVKCHSAIEIDGDLNHDGSKVGLYGKSPVVKASAVGKLTDSTGGTPSSTLGAVSGSGDDAQINDNFASIDTKFDKIIDAIGTTSGIAVTAD